MRGHLKHRLSERERHGTELQQAGDDDRSEEMLSILRRLPPYIKLDARVTALEDWRGRLGSDPIEVIRERFGLRKSSD